ncbi:hypothetical protein JCM16303_004442 [Sporobolomyces ruberrimus]
MSRHRAVKNLDLDDELDDGGFDSGEDYYEDMTSEQQAQMVASVKQVEQVLGPSSESGISSKEIRDSLWDSYFDVEGTVSYYLDQVHKREQRKKKELGNDPSLDSATSSLSVGETNGVDVKMENLSLDPTHPPTPLSSSSPLPPKVSKLSSKIASSKLSKTSALPPPPTSATPSSEQPSSSTSIVPTKKPLSKLQQKMLLSKKKDLPSTSTTTSPPIEPTEPITTKTSEDMTLSNNPSLELSPIFSEPPPKQLAANPSPFASSLLPSQSPTRGGGQGGGGIELARHLAKSINVVGGAGGTRGRKVEDLWGLSPDDKVLEARKGTALGSKQRQAKEAATKKPTLSSTNSSPKISLKKPGSSSTTTLSSGSSSSISALPRVDQLKNDMDALGLSSSPKKSLVEIESEEKAQRLERERISREEEKETEQVVLASKEKILKEVREKESLKGEKRQMALVVIGHVDAGKSTLMGRVLHELGETEDRVVEGFQRQSAKMGKASFAYAWTFDALAEERERGVTIDVAIDSFETKNRKFTLIDAPGHRDFIPNMISGAAQADVAILVVDGSSGAFEKGFEGGGQTREHAVLVRSLGVQQLVVAVNKLDAVDWSQKRFEAIKSQLWPFLTTQTGFTGTNIHFVPVGAMSGENLVEARNEVLKSWWSEPGHTLVETLDLLQVPTRSLDAPLRIPVSNVFKGQSATASGLAVSGRVESGLVQVGERLSALPGDETGVVRAIEVDTELVPYALAGANATLFLSGIDALQLSIGTVLCPPSQPIPVVSAFLAQIIVFEPKYPITAGYAVELFHHSKDIPASIARLDAVLDRTTGEVIKSKPRLLAKNSSAKVLIQLRPSAGIRSSAIPIEPFSVNKSMGRVLFRRGGETVAAGIVLECLS